MEYDAYINKTNIYKYACSLNEDGKCLTGSSIIKIILGILFEGFLNSILSVSGSKVRGGVLFSTRKFL